MDCRQAELCNGYLAAAAEPNPPKRLVTARVFQIPHWGPQRSGTQDLAATGSLRSWARSGTWHVDYCRHLLHCARPAALDDDNALSTALIVHF